MPARFPLSHETFKVNGACFEVYNEKGCGFTEPIYQECLEIEFSLQGILFVPKESLTITYKGRLLRKTFEPDFVCFERVIVEIKAVANLNDEHRAQVLNYLNASTLEVALLINFGHYPHLQYERFIR